jgi:hypothetical protein
MRQKALLEASGGQKPISQEEMQQLEDSLFLELTQKLNTAGTQEDMEEVRKKLSNIQSTPEPTNT